MSEYKVLLDDIIAAIEKIEVSTKNIIPGKLRENLDIWDATLMRLQVIGESVKKMPLDIKKRYRGIEWRKLSQLRNIISQDYFIVNPAIVEDIVRNKLASVKENIKIILEKEK